jgi:hypothetical protein
LQLVNDLACGLDLSRKQAINQRVSTKRDILIYSSKYKQLPEQNVLNQWISQVHPQQSITYTNKKPAKALHKKV